MNAISYKEDILSRYSDSPSNLNILGVQFQQVPKRRNQALSHIRRSEDVHNRFGFILIYILLCVCWQ